MEWITIELSGADSAHRNRINQTVSRLFVFPDGISRHITLKVWYWISYDRLQAACGFADDDFTRGVYELSTKWSRLNGTDFELELRDGFATAIRQGIWGHEEDGSAVANSNPIHGNKDECP